MSRSGWSADPVDVLAAGPGFDLSALDRASTPGWTRDHRAAEKHLLRVGARMSKLQELLFAHGRTGGRRSVLLVLQGIDTAGKGGTVRHVLGLVDPQGVALRSFGVPTEAERAHHYLWRIRSSLPRPGYIGVFDRSHYEDVLVVRVDNLVPKGVWEPRYEEINAFEAEVAAAGTVIVKVMLMVSPDEQAARLRERLERPDKHWKYNPGDIDTREKWWEYQEAYQAVLDRTSTGIAPWYVIPADHKWYTRLAVSELLTRALESLDLSWPAADFDVVTELARLDASHPEATPNRAGNAH
jgi:PPK2 family polyphosphate:nucleotide phosphotransferase